MISDFPISLLSCSVKTNIFCTRFSCCKLRLVDILCGRVALGLFKPPTRKKLAMWQNCNIHEIMSPKGYTACVRACDRKRVPVRACCWRKLSHRIQRGWLCGAGVSFIFLRVSTLESANLYTPERKSCRGVTGTTYDYARRSNMITCSNSACV